MVELKCDRKLQAVYFCAAGVRHVRIIIRRVREESRLNVFPVEMKCREVEQQPVLEQRELRTDLVVLDGVALVALRNSGEDRGIRIRTADAESFRVRDVQQGAPV